MPITVNHSTLADGTFSAAGAVAWDANHTLSGLGTMAEQNANNVNITGGSITGVTGVGTVTSVGISAPSIFTVGGSPVTGSGTLALTYSGTALPVANGGTGATTLTGLVVGNGTSAMTTVTAPSGAVVGTTDTQTLTNKTLTNPTTTNYTETLYSPAAGSAFTVALTDGTVQKFTTNANTTVTLPSSVSGKSFVIMIAYGGSHSITWAGGSTIKWAGGTTPTATAVNGKFDIFTFFQDGTNTYASVLGQNY